MLTNFAQAIYATGSNWLTMGITGWLAGVAVCLAGIAVSQWQEGGRYSALRMRFRLEAAAMAAVAGCALVGAAILAPVAFNF
jgi:hypothetical protein